MRGTRAGEPVDQLGAPAVGPGRQEDVVRDAVGEERRQLVDPAEARPELRRLVRRLGLVRDRDVPDDLEAVPAVSGEVAGELAGGAAVADDDQPAPRRAWSASSRRRQR